MRVCGGTGCLSWGNGFQLEMMEESGGGHRQWWQWGEERTHDAGEGKNGVGDQKMGKWKGFRRQWRWGNEITVPVSVKGERGWKENGFGGKFLEGENEMVGPCFNLCLKKKERRESSNVTEVAHACAYHYSNR